MMIMMVMLSSSHPLNVLTSTALGGDAKMVVLVVVLTLERCSS